jgi:hypothetical protein
VTSDIYVILTELVALPLLAIAQQLSGNAAGSPTDHQEELKWGAPFRRFSADAFSLSKRGAFLIMR